MALSPPSRRPGEGYEPGRPVGILAVAVARRLSEGKVNEALARAAWEAINAPLEVLTAPRPRRLLRGTASPCTIQAVGGVP